MKVFLDSCFLIYLNAMVDEGRRPIEELFRGLLKEQLFINMLVVDEVLYVSRKYGVTYENTLGFLKSIVLPYSEVLPIEEDDLRPAEKYLLRYNLRTSDAIHLATMEKAGISSIVSEDQGFDKVKEIKRIWITPDAVFKP